MKNYIQPGHTLALAVPYDVASGGGFLLGGIFGVSNISAVAGEEVEASLVGVFELTKAASQTWSAGDKVYWDDTNKVVTKTATGNTLIGVAVEAVGGTASETIGRVRLNGSF
ncbi:MAG: DUF2190 family protein [Terasakiella sp.]|uniref:DUF2190 family protein n=1 Tax=unclassified Terasakiella TaxID=2614952 RepID=UPI003B00EB2D